MSDAAMLEDLQGVGEILRAMSVSSLYKCT